MAQAFQMYEGLPNTRVFRFTKREFIQHLDSTSRERAYHPSV